MPGRHYRVVVELGYSFCPNDTFIFYALTHGRLGCGAPVVREVLEDVETLNRWALEGRLPLTKISYAAYGQVRDQYVALRAGGAFGRGVGPMVVAREALGNLAGHTVAIPGELTTAALLLRLSQTEAPRTVAMRYDAILPAVERGEVDAGLIIHESRFTYQSRGLVAVLDLGEWWARETGLPIPLGAILARRDLGLDRLAAINQSIRDSLEYAWQHPAEPAAYMREHALESDASVVRQHVDTYVNDLSRDVGDEGESAVRELFARAQALGLMPANTLPLFAGALAGA